MEWENKKLLGEIYDKAVGGSGYMRQVEHEVGKHLEEILSVYRETLTEEDYMELEEVVVSGAVAAEKAAFLAGTCYGMQLLWEGLSVMRGGMEGSVEGSGTQDGMG